MREIKCVICGRELHYMAEHLIVSTKNKGIEGACRQHAYSQKLINYIKKNGGEKPLQEAIKEL